MQLKDGYEARKKLEGNLSAALGKREGSSQVRSTPTFMSNVTPVTDTLSKNHETPKVVIYHDSLCNSINESLMGREAVTVSTCYGHST